MGEKEPILKFSGVIVELKKNALFTVKLDQNGQLVNAHASGRLRRNRIRCLLNDKVEVEISPYNLKLGRIVFRF